MAATDSSVGPDSAQKFLTSGFFRRRSRNMPPAAIAVGQRWHVYSADQRAWQDAAVTRVDGRLVVMRCHGASPELRDDIITIAEFMLNTPSLYRYTGRAGE